MNVLLLRPDPGNERFGLGPFFRVEPLGLEYVGAALRARGHDPRIADLRFGGRVGSLVRRTPPAGRRHLLHARARVRPGHRGRARSAPRVARDVRAGRRPRGVRVSRAPPGSGDRRDLHRRRRRGRAGDGRRPRVRAAADRGPRPARPRARRLDRPRRLWTTARRSTPCRPRRATWWIVSQRYHCLLFKPVWLVETARGCPFRCNFCSVWQLYGRSFRERSIGAVVDDFAAVGDAVFVADDLFWNHPERSRELAAGVDAARSAQALAPGADADGPRDAATPTCSKRGGRSRRTSTSSSASRRRRTRGSRASRRTRASRPRSRRRASRARSATASPATSSSIPTGTRPEFEELWDFVAANGFQRAGYTILTPLPGTELFQKLSPILQGQPWFKYDMHHLLWEPKLGAKRFFELYAETWRRSILNTSGRRAGSTGCARSSRRRSRT